MLSTSSFLRLISQCFWVILPVLLMTQFEKCIMFGLQIIFGDNINPAIFFYLPFLSLLPPLVLLAVVYWQKRKGVLNSWVVATKESMAGDLFTGMLTGLIALVIFYVSASLLRELEFQTPDFSSFTTTHHLFFSTLGAVIPGIAEELYFREFLSQKMKSYHFLFVIFISAISFSLWHILSPSYLLHTFLLGLLFGFLYHKINRLLPVIVAHTFLNMSVGILIMSGLY